jgi:hypothetical protein
LRSIAISGLVALAAGLGICAVALPAANATSAAPAAASRPATTIPVTGALKAEHAIAGMRAAGIASPAAAAPAANNQLIDVSCIHADDCLAVGGNFAGGTAHGRPLAFLQNASGWHATAVPLPSGGTVGVLGGVSCTSDGCLAVGWYAKSGHNFPLAELWKGNGWKLIAQPAVATGGTSDFLEFVSCATSVSSCVATGFYVPRSSSTGEVSLAEVWNGTSWKAYHPPSPATPFSNLDAVSCPQANFCVAAGGYLASNGGLLLADMWNGSVWTQVAVRQPTPQAGWFNFINGISCPSTVNCVAVGNTGQLQSNGSLKIAAFAEVRNSSAWSWSATSVPMPQGHPSLLLTPACVSATFCLAVGGVGPYTSTNNEGHAAVATWNGSKWSVKVFTPPATEGSLLMGDACVSPTSCVATGTIGTYATQTGRGLTALWNGTTWRLANIA